MIDWKTCPSWDVQTFSGNTPPNSTNIFHFHTESSPLHFLFSLFYSLKTAYTIGSPQNTDRSEQNRLFTQKAILIDLWFFHRNVLFPRILHIKILTSIQPQFFSGTHICQNSLTTHWMIKLRKKIILLLHNTIPWVNSSFWLLNQVSHLESTISAFYQHKFSTYFLCSSYRFRKSFSKYFSIWTC